VVDEPAAAAVAEAGTGAALRSGAAGRAAASGTVGTGDSP
jgi:hypothetical protein